MPLPIMILVERHWDTTSKKALSQALPFLKSSGYDTLCFESPCDINMQDTINNVSSTIQSIENYLKEANQHLAKRSISVDLTTINYSDSEQLLRYFVSSRHSKEMALWFRELPGHQEKYTLINMALEQSMTISGIDLTRKSLESINSLEAQANLNKRLAGIDQLDSIRTLGFKEKLLALQQQGKGVIFVVGQAHYQLLIAEFAKDYLLDELLFLHPYSPQCFDSSYIDYRLPSVASEVRLVEQVINQDDDIALFINALQAVAQPLLDTAKPIRSTSICQRLSEKTNLSFEAYVRPSHLVDGYHFFTKKEDIANSVTELNKQGVHGFYTFFKEKEAYCVANINTVEVASKIQA